VQAGVEITTHRLAKCEWHLEMASNFLNLLASLASGFFLLSVSLFSPLIESYSSAILKYKHNFGKLFSDLASKNFELLTSLASALKVLIPQLVKEFKIVSIFFIMLLIHMPFVLSYFIYFLSQARLPP
jgi:hypothetical protein